MHERQSTRPEARAYAKPLRPGTRRTVSDRRNRIAALVSLLPILFGIGFVVYAFTVGAVTKIVISGESQVSIDETIVEAGGSAGFVFAFAPLVLGVFIAILLRLARKDSDQLALNMAWAFSAFVAIASVAGSSTLGVYFFVPALLMLLATAMTQLVIRRLQNSSRQGPYPG